MLASPQAPQTSQSWAPPANGFLGFSHHTWAAELNSVWCFPPFPFLFSISSPALLTKQPDDSKTLKGSKFCVRWTQAPKVSKFVVTRKLRILLKIQLENWEHHFLLIHKSIWLSQPQVFPNHVSFKKYLEKMTWSAILHHAIGPIAKCVGITLPYRSLLL